MSRKRPTKINRCTNANRVQLSENNCIRLRTARLNAHMTISEAAQHAGFSREMLSGCELGRWGICKNYLESLVQLYGVTTEWILTDEPPPLIFEGKVIEETEWVDIPGYDGVFQITRNGVVRARPYRNARGDLLNRGILKQHLQPHGYKQVSLVENGDSRNRNIHSLLMVTFVGERPPGYHINHIDGNKLNNALGNLEYCTPSENSAHAWRLGLVPKMKSANARTAKLTEDQVRAILSELKAGIPRKELQEKYGVTKKTIWAIANNKTWRDIERDAA